MNVVFAGPELAEVLEGPSDTLRLDDAGVFSNMLLGLVALNFFDGRGDSGSGRFKKLSSRSSALRFDPTDVIDITEDVGGAAREPMDKGFDRIDE